MQNLRDEQGAFMCVRRLQEGAAVITLVLYCDGGVDPIGSRDREKPPHLPLSITASFSITLGMSMAEHGLPCKMANAWMSGRWKKVVNPV